MSDLMKDKTVEFLREAANYFANRPTNGEDRAYWANVYNSEKCIKAADEIEQLRNHVAYQQAEIEGLKIIIKDLERRLEHAEWLIDKYRKEEETK